MEMDSCTKIKRHAPSEIEIMLRCYYEAYPKFKPTEANDRAIWKLSNEGLIIFQDPCWTPTEKGSTWVEMICHTPLPEKRTKWYDPRTNEAIKNCTN